MPWPSLEESVRAIDISWFQNNGGLLRQPFDVDNFCELNPDIELVIIRAIWPSGTPDPHYAHYFDGFTKNNRKVAGYVWPAKVDQWKVAFGARVPRMIGSDHEDWSGNKGYTREQHTSDLHRTQENLRTAFPSAHVTAKSPYSRGSWLDSHILASQRVNEYQWWLAHWPYPPHLGGTRQVRSFAEADPMLPVDNNFTPYRSKLHKIPAENVTGWQVSSQGQFPGIKGYVDMGYWRRAHIAAIYGEAPPPPPPPPAERPKVTVSYNDDKVEVVLESA